VEEGDGRLGADEQLNIMVAGKGKGRRGGLSGQVCLLRGGSANGWARRRRKERNHFVKPHSGMSDMGHVGQGEETEVTEGESKRRGESTGLCTLRLNPGSAGTRC